jgi:AmmeMemoRadiSam system protein A
MPDDFELTDQEKQALLSLARLAIESKLTGNKFPLPDKTPGINRKAGAFVTLRVHRLGAEPKLRGCIGHVVASKSLYETVREAAVSSAVADPRFPPMTADELADVEIEISVLSPFRRIQDPTEVLPGTHGVYLKKGYASGLLLPQVATEYGWDRETFLRHTCLKAGLPPGCIDQDDVEAYVFTAVVFDEALFRV